MVPGRSFRAILTAMRKRSSSRDVNEKAFGVVEEMTKAVAEKKKKKNPAAVALGKLGGKKGGPARAEKLTAEQRREIAKRAAQARWSVNQ